MIQFRVVQTYDGPDMKPGATIVELINPLTGELLDRQRCPLSMEEMSEFMVNFYGYRAEILPPNIEAPEGKVNHVTTTQED